MEALIHLLQSVVAVVQLKETEVRRAVEAVVAEAKERSRHYRATKKRRRGRPSKEDGRACLSLMSVPEAAYGQRFAQVQVGKVSSDA